MSDDAALLLGVGPGFAGLFIMWHRRANGDGDNSLPELLRRFAGAPPSDPPGPKSLKDQDLAVLPLASIWPFAASFGLAVVGSGLIFGLWLVILGLGIAAIQPQPEYSAMPRPRITSHSPRIRPDPTTARPNEAANGQIEASGSTARSWSFSDLGPGGSLGGAPAKRRSSSGSELSPSPLARRCHMMNSPANPGPTPSSSSATVPSAS